MGERADKLAVGKFELARCRAVQGDMDGEDGDGEDDDRDADEDGEDDDDEEEEEDDEAEAVSGLVITEVEEGAVAADYRAVRSGPKASRSFAEQPS